MMRMMRITWTWSQSEGLSFGASTLHSGGIHQADPVTGACRVAGSWWNLREIWRMSHESPKIFNFARSTEARHFASPDCNLLPPNTLKDSRSANAPCHLNWGTFFQRIRDILWRLMTLDLGMMFPQHRWNCIVAKRKLHKTAAVVKAAKHHVVQHLLR